jgi:hypothetical protein
MSALQNPQVGQTSITLSTDAASQTYVAPFIAQMAANAEGTVGVLQRANVTITGVDETFELCLSAADSVNLLNAFHVYKSDAGAIDGVLDTSAGVTVDMSGAEILKSALRAALDAAMSTGEHMPVDGAQVAAKRNIADYLKREAYVDTRDQLAYDTLANLLEASDLASFSLVLDVSGGAKNMYDAMNGTGVNAPRYRRTIFTQLPESNIEAYLNPNPASGGLVGHLNAEPIEDIHFMPFISGDKIYFVFDAIVGETTIDAGNTAMPTSGALVTREVKDADYADKLQIGSAGMAGLATLGKNAAEYANGASLTFNAPTKRRIGVSVKVAKREAATSGSDLDATNTQPFNIELAPGVIVDPSGEHYAFQVAAGLLADAAELKLSASAPSGTHAMEMPSPPATAAVDLSGQDLSGGAYAVATVLSSLPAVQSSGGVLGKWLIVNAANANQFVLNGSDVEYRARIATAPAADYAELYYVSNVGKSGPVVLLGGASYSVQA